MSSLKYKSVVGIFWSLLEKFGFYFIKLIFGIILARLLTPQDFGLIGMITVFFSISDVIINGGLASAYIQKKDVSKIDADTIFLSNLLLSIGIYLGLFFLAPLIAKFYKETQLISLVRVMGVVVIVNSFNIIQRAQISRDLDFRKKAIISTVSIIISGGLGITAAYHGFGVWSLVFQSLLNRVLNTIGYWKNARYRPGLVFSKKSFKELFSFGYWMLLSNVVRKLFDNIYILTIGKFFPVAQLGFYTKAKQFQSIASEQLSGAIGSVSFPVYSKLQNEKERLRNAMEKFLKHSLLFIAPILVILIVISKPFVLLALTEKWGPMIPYLQLLCVIGFFYPLNMVNVQAITAQGKSQLSFKIGLVRNGLRVVNIFLMYQYGVLFIIIGEIVVSFIALILNTWYSYRFVNFGLFKQLGCTWQIIVGSVIAGVLGYLPNFYFSNLWLLFVTGFIITTIIYFAIQFLINRGLMYSVLSLRLTFNNNNY